VTVACRCRWHFRLKTSPMETRLYSVVISILIGIAKTAKQLLQWP
jgi:hypothetical protein